MDKVKLGLKTTEFWLALLGAIIPVLNQYLGLNLPGEALLGILGVVITYIASRTWLKKSAIQNAARMLIIFFLPLALLSCAHSKAGVATKSLLAMKTTIISIADAADKMCALGHLNQKQCDMAKNIYGKSQVSYDLTADALIVAVKLGDTQSQWERFKIFHEQFLQFYQDMYNIGIEFKLIPAIEGGAQ